MEERTITAVTPIEETDWGKTQCMSSNEQMEEVCTRSAEKELALEYDNEPDKTFYTCLCEDCASDYVKKWDAAQIFGDSVLEEDNPYKVK